MIYQVEVLDLRRMLKEKVEEIFCDKKIADEVFMKLCAIENDERIKVVSINDEK